LKTPGFLSKKIPKKPKKRLNDRFLGIKKSGRAVASVDQPDAREYGGHAHKVR
jgi:hypothetical protein